MNPLDVIKRMEKYLENVGLRHVYDGIKLQSAENIRLRYEIETKCTEIADEVLDYINRSEELLASTSDGHLEKIANMDDISRSKAILVMGITFSTLADRFTRNFGEDDVALALTCVLSKYLEVKNGGENY